MTIGERLESLPGMTYRSLGEGIEKEGGDFAADVAAMIKPKH